MSTLRKTVLSCLWVGGFEDKLFKKSVDLENSKFIILKDKTSRNSFWNDFFVFCVFWAILEALNEITLHNISIFNQVSSRKSDSPRKRVKVWV